MNKIKYLLLSLLIFLGAICSLKAADDDLYAAMFVDNLFFEAYNEHGMTENIEQLAQMADMKVLERVAKGASSMKKQAELALKVVKAYQEGKSGTEIAAMVARELGEAAYKKIKNAAVNYIRKSVPGLSELEKASQVYGALYKSSSYIAYLGMSIGLDMMSEETIARLEQSGFHKSAVWITENVDNILSMAEQGKEEAIKQFLVKTEGTAFHRFAENVVDKVKTVGEYAHQGAMDIGQKIIDFPLWGYAADGWSELYGKLTGGGDSGTENTPSGDSVTNGGSDTSTPDGDSVISSGSDSGNNDSDSTPSGDGVVTGNNDQNGGDSNASPAGDDVANGSDDQDYYLEHSSDDEAPPLGQVINKIQDNSPVVLPNIPHIRVLWIFSGEPWDDVIGSAAGGVRDLFSNGSFSRIKDKISDEMGWQEMKAAFGSLGN